MANRYDITVRAFYEAGDEAEKISEMSVERWDNLSAQETSVLIQQMLNNCIADYRAGYCLDPDATEESIVDNFNELTQTLFDLEQSHDEQSVTFKILHGFITVQVIYPKEEST